MITSATPAQVKLVYRDRVAWLLIAGLLFLRFPLLFLAALVQPETTDLTLSMCEIGTYLLVAGLVVWERDRLAESNIDGLAIGLLLLKPCELLFYTSGNFGYHSSPAYLLYIPIALGMAAGLLHRRPAIQRPAWKSLAWMAAGILAGMAMGIGMGYAFNHLRISETVWEGQMTLAQIVTTPGAISQLLAFLVRNPIQQTFYAGGMEEPLFRGFLWGALRRAGWKDGWICLFQAGLFCFGHIYYLVGGQYWSFGFTFVAAIVLGLLAWRSRSLAPSMLAHGFTNGWGDVFSHMIRW